MNASSVYDLIVCGAGPSGVCAALSAARLGLQVLLIDQNGFPGGMNTAALVGPLMTFHSGSTQIAKGIAQEIVDELAKRGGTLGHIPDPIGMVPTITPVDPELLKLVYFDLLRKESNITLLLRSVITGVTADSVTVHGKGGTKTYRARRIIDATGDGDVAALMGVPFKEGRESDGFAQPMTLMFTVENVDRTQVIDYIRSRPDQFVMDRSCSIDDYIAVSGFFELVQQAQEKGELTFPRDRVLFFEGVQKGTVTVNMTRVTLLKGTRAEDLSVAESETHRQLDEALAFFRKYLPGFENCRLKSVAALTGVRESRRIQGIKTLTQEDIWENRAQEDSVGICAYPIDIHDPTGKTLVWDAERGDCCYDIPYGILVPENQDYLLAAGRCVSATHEALASVRISVACMVMGQAAGTAAYLSIQKDVPFKDVPVNELQQLLHEQGAIPGKKWLEKQGEENDS
ncbi:MAG: FAD-dependent oxidoreductase [Clostridia bacterium]|nr:FAD-dependent oxidoreductase [Clostridia bacterium]